MKYKVGDKVKIKTWEQMEKEYGKSYLGNVINCQPIIFIRAMERAINGIKDRILLIKFIRKGDEYNYYVMSELGYHFSDDMIECLAKEYFKKLRSEFINSRFEILDIRK